MRIPTGVYIDQPSFPLLEAIISYYGVTTADGAATGLTLVCNGLATEPSYARLTVKILDGGAAGQMRVISAHVAGSNILTVAEPFTDSAGLVVQVLTGTRFVIISGGSYHSTSIFDEDTHVHINDVLEQIVFTEVIAQRLKVWSIWLDLVNLTQNCIIRVSYQIDGAVYTVFQTINWTVGMDDGVLIQGGFVVNNNIRVTLQSAVLEGVARDVVYQVFKETMN